jgi:hypothetical protein
VVLDGYPSYEDDHLSEKINRQLPIKSSSSGYTEEECPELKTTLVKHARVPLPPQSTQIIITDEDPVVLEELPPRVHVINDQEANFEITQDHLKKMH